AARELAPPAVPVLDNGDRGLAAAEGDHRALRVDVAAQDERRPGVEDLPRRRNGRRDPDEDCERERNHARTLARVVKAIAAAQPSAGSARTTPATRTPNAAANAPSTRDANGRRPRNAIDHS